MTIRPSDLRGDSERSQGQEKILRSRMCHGCGKGKGPNPFVDNPLQLDLCPLCAGKLCAAIVRYFRDRQKAGLQGPRRKLNAKLPLRDQHGVWRCRRCDHELVDWKVLDPIFCEQCQ